MSFTDTADRRVAGHLPECLDAVREQQGPPAHPGTGERGLGASVAATHDDDVESCIEQHDFTGVFVYRSSAGRPRKLPSHHTAKCLGRGSAPSTDVTATARRGNVSRGTRAGVWGATLPPHFLDPQVEWRSIPPSDFWIPRVQRRSRSAEVDPDWCLANSPYFFVAILFHVEHSRSIRRPPSTIDAVTDPSSAARK